MAPITTELLRELGIIPYSQIKKKRDAYKNDFIQGFIPRRSLGIMVGEWGLGKSPFGIQMAICAAVGIPFLGMNVSKKCRVLYVDFENSAKGFCNIVEGLCKHLQLDPRNLEDNFYSWGLNYSDDPRDSSLLMKTVKERVKQMVQSLEPDIVIVDPLRIYDSRAESKNEFAAEMVKELRGLKSTNRDTSILYIHHPNKPDHERSYRLDRDPHLWMTRASGSSALVQNVDFRIALEVHQQDGVMLRFFQRNVGWSKPTPLSRAMDGENPIGYVKGSFKSLEVSRKELFEQLSDEFATADLKNLSGLSSNPANEVLDKWIDEDKVIKVKHGLYRKVSSGSELSELSSYSSENKQDESSDVGELSMNYSEEAVGLSATNNSPIVQGPPNF